MILLWLARNMERFCDSWIDWGSAIFLKNCAALKYRCCREERSRTVAQTGPRGLPLPPHPESHCLLSLVTPTSKESMFWSHFIWHCLDPHDKGT